MSGWKLCEITVFRYLAKLTSIAYFAFYHSESDKIETTDDLNTMLILCYAKTKVVQNIHK